MEWPELLQRSYVPYSGKSAACIVAGGNGRLYPGIRIENIAFPDTISEFQVALFTCIAEGDRPVKLIMPSETGDNSELLAFWKKEYGFMVCRTDEPVSGDFYDPLIKADIDPSIELVNLLEKAVVPNSGFPVSALVETDSGYISGVNIECHEWRLGLCAERMAVAKSLASGYGYFHAIHIHSKGGDYSSPCGACRQVLTEHMPDKPVYLYHSDNSHSYHLCRHLLPFSFTSSVLRKS